MGLNKFIEHISLKLGLTVTEIKTFCFILFVFFTGLVLKHLKYDFRQNVEQKYAYDIYDSLFNTVDSSIFLNYTAQKKSEKRVDSEAELSDFSNDKKDSKKKQSSFIEPNSININTADEETLRKLPGVGKVTASRIIEYRKKKGRFKNINELLQVKRIGEKRLEKLKEYLYIEN